MPVTIDGTNGLTFPDSSTQASAGLTEGYTAKSWVNFSDTGTVAIRADENVSSITDNGTGNYTVNFTTAMPDANYCVIASGNDNFADASFRMTNLGQTSNITTGSCQIFSKLVNQFATGFEDLPVITVAIFR